MPLIEITLSSGRDPETLRRLLGAVHETVRDTLGANEASVRVILREVPPEHWLSGGRTLAEKAAGGA